MRKYIILCLFIFYFSFSGCNQNTTKKSVNETYKLEPSEIESFFVVFFSYLDANNKMPSSIEEIESFCETNPNLQYKDINWRRFSWQELEQGKVEIQYKGPNYSMPFVIETDPQLMDTSGDLNKYIEDKLQEQLGSNK